MDRVLLRIWRDSVELASELVDEKMGLPSWLGLAMAQGGSENEAHRSGEVEAPPFACRFLLGRMWRLV